MTTASAPRILDGFDWEGKIYSDGWRAGDAESIPVSDKSTGERLGTLGIASANDVARAAASAARAQVAWAATPRDERAAILARAKDLLAEHRDEFAWWLVRESGSTIPKASFEIDVTLAKFDQIISELRTGAFEEVLADDGGYRSVAQRVPLGVVGVIGPFNFPLYLCLRAVLPALAFGNAVVLKPDQQTAVASGILTAEIFAEAGLPKGVLHVLPGDAEPGAALAVDPNVAMICVHRLECRRQADRQRCRRQPQARIARIGREQPLRRLGGRRHRGSRALRRVGILPAPRADLHGVEPAPGPREHRGCIRRRLTAHAERLVVGDPAAGDVHVRWTTRAQSLDACEREWCISTIRR